jgi:hypothetical protein
MRQVLCDGKPSDGRKTKDDDAPIQNVPIRPKQPSSILVDTGFMFLLTLNAELWNKEFKIRPRHVEILNTHSTRMMARVTEDTKIANGTKRAIEKGRRRLVAGLSYANRDSLRSEGLSTLWKCTAMAKQIILHRNTSAMMASS